MKIAIIICAFLAVVLADEPCCMKGQFTMTLWEKTFMLKGKTPLPPRKQVMELYGDTDKNRNAVILHGKAEGFIVIEDFAQNITYTFNKEQKYCKIGKVPTPNYHCIPKDAVKVATSTFGGDSGIPVEIWQGTFDYPVAKGKYNIGIAEECVPMFEDIEGIAKDVKFDTTYLFSDFKNTVDDPTIFNVPEFCQ